MPASKKDLKKQQQKANVEKGIGDAKGRMPSRTKVTGNTQELVYTICLIQSGRFLGGEVEKVGPNPSLA